MNGYNKNIKSFIQISYIKLTNRLFYNPGGQVFIINKNKALSANRNIKDNYKLGIFMMIMSSVCFALMAAIVKYIGNFQLMEIVLFRNIPSMIIMPMLLKKKNIPLFGNNKFILSMRGIFGMIGMIGMFYTYKIMLLTDAVTIQKLAPFFVIIFSGLFLKEKICFQQIPIFLLAFLGGLLIVRPGFRIDLFPAIIGLFAAISMAAAHVTLRYLRLSDHYLVIINYFAYISGVTSLIILLFQRNLIIPSLPDFLVLIFLGIVGLFSQITLTKAYQLAPASLITLYSYLEIVFSIIFSIFLFREMPNIVSISGASFIIISGYLNYRLRVPDQKI